MKLKKQIAQCENKIEYKRQLAIKEYHQLKAALRKKHVFPYTIGIISLLGFLLVYKISTKKAKDITDKKPIIEHKSNKRLFEIVLTTFNLIQFIDRHFLMEKPHRSAVIKHRE